MTIFYTLAQNQDLKTAKFYCTPSQAMIAASSTAKRLSVPVEIIHWRDGLRATVNSDGTINENDRAAGAAVAVRCDGRRLAYKILAA